MKVTELLRLGFPAALAVFIGCAQPDDPAMRPFRMNPYPLSSPEAEQLKYPPGGGTGVYWLDGRYNVTLDNINDEANENEKAIFAETLCFRQEGQCVYARNKSGELLVLNLSSASFKKGTKIDAFTLPEQAVLVKLGSKSRGNIYFDSLTLMPNL